MPGLGSLPPTWKPRPRRQAFLTLLPHPLHFHPSPWDCNAPDISPTSLLSSPPIAPHPSAAYDRARITACVSLLRPRLEALCTTPTAPNNNVFPVQVQQKGLFANYKHPPARYTRYSLFRRPAEPDSHLQWCPERRETWVTAASRERKWQLELAGLRETWHEEPSAW